MRGSLLMLTALMMIAARSHAEEALPAGFLEFLGGMLEVEGDAGKTLLDPLDFESPLELQDPLQAADGEGVDPADDSALDSEPVEEVLP